MLTSKVTANAIFRAYFSCWDSPNLIVIARNDVRFEVRSSYETVFKNGRNGKKRHINFMVPRKVPN